MAEYLTLYWGQAPLPCLFSLSVCGGWKGNPSTLSGSIRRAWAFWMGERKTRDQLCKVVRDLLWSHKMPTAGQAITTRTTTSGPSMSFLLQRSLSLPLVGSFFSLFEDEMTASRFIFKPLKKLTKKKEKEAMGG